MKKNNFLIILLFIGFVANAQDWLYSSHFGGTGNNNLATTATDSSNVYSLGTFDGNVDGIGDSWGYRDIYLEKYSYNLNLLWRKRFGSDNQDFVNYKGLSYYNHNLFFTGSIKGDCKFDSDTLFNTGILDAFGAVYNDNGALQWVKQVAWGPSAQVGSDVEILDDNLIFVGAFIDSMIVGDSINALNVDTIYSYSGKDFYLLEYDQDGNYLNNWVIHTTSNLSNINSIGKIGSDLYITGYFSDSLFFGTDTIVSAGGQDIFLMKFNFTSGVQWIRRVGGDLNDVILTITFSQNNDIYISGYFLSSNLTIDSTATELSDRTFSSLGDRDAISLKYDEDGTFQDVIVYGTANRDEFYGSSYKNNNLLLSGGYSDSLIIGTDTIRSVGDEDAFFAVFDENYIPFASATVGGSSTDISYDAEIDYDNNFVFSGRFKSDTLFIRSKIDPTNIDTLVNVNVGSYDAFIAKYGCRTDISITYQQTPTTCPGGSNGKLLAIPSEVDSWAYTWDGQNATGETSSQVTNLVDSVWYYTTITSPKGCAYNDSIQMTHKPALQATLIDTLTVRCDNSNDGIAAVIPSNGNITGDTLTSDYHYLWSDGSTDSLRTDLGVGQYTVTVSDLCGDTSQVVDTINIGYLPKLQAYIQNQNVIVLCDTSTNGIGRVIYQDGVAPYSFQWENSNSDTSIARDLNVGLHHVTITDFCNQPIVDSVRIVNIPTIGAAIVESEVENATCSGMNNGKARVRVYNGVEPYNYAWSQSASDTSFANDLPGDSMVYVTVSDICHQIVDSVRIGVNPEMEITIDNIVNARCRTTNDGQAHISLNNEQGDITYAWSLSASDSANAVDLPGDTMVYVSVTDMCGTKTDSAHIGLNPALEISFTNVNSANCQNSADGQAMAIVENWQDTVAYLWENGDTLALSTSLNGGYQHITVTDLCGPVVDSVEIGVKPAMTVDATVQDNKCNSDSTGSVLLTTENAFGLIHYLWSNNDTTSNPDSLTAGTYFYTVVDACNDTIRDSIVVNQPTKLQDSVVVTNASDLNTADGSAILIASGGTGTYNYDWSNGNISADNLNLQVGTYYYTITDANNCTVSDSVVIDANEYDVVIYNTFTPNGDGVNDVWNIKNINYFPKATVKIYSQWGNQVFSSEEGYPKAWDGTNNGKELPAGTYYYIIKLDENTPDKSGYVTIVK